MWTRRTFRDRREAGWRLAEALARHADLRPLVLALPRGGVPVAYEVATALRADLDILLVRKLGVPGHEELAMGAIASDGIQVIDESLVEHFRVSPQVLQETIARESAEI